MVTLAASLRSYRDFRMHDNQYMDSVNGDRHDDNKRFSKIYGEKFLLGSYLTAPLRNYENASCRLSLLNRHITAVERGGMSCDLVLGSVFLVVDVIARAILSFVAFIGDGINSGITLCFRKRLLAERDSENKNYDVSRSLEYLSSGLSDDLTQRKWSHTWIYSKGGAGIASSSNDMKMEDSEFITWKAAQDEKSTYSSSHSEIFDEFSLSYDSLEIRGVSSDLVLPYSTTGEFSRESHAKAATDALAKHLTDYFSLNRELTLQGIEVFVNGDYAFVKVFYRPFQAETRTPPAPSISANQEAGKVFASLVGQQLTVAPKKEQGDSWFQSMVSFAQGALVGSDPGYKLEEYIGIIETEIVKYNKFYQLGKRIRDPKSNFSSISVEEFNLDVRSVFDSYSKGHYVSIVFSLDPDCSSEIEAIRAKRHTIELLNENDEVVETFAREITKDTIDHIEGQKLHLTINYIKDFIKKMSSTYRWSPTAASICGASQGEGLDSQGRIMLKIYLPDRLGGKLLAGNGFSEIRAPADLLLRESV